MVALYGRCLAQVGEGDGPYAQYEPVQLVRERGGAIELVVPDRAYNLYCQREALLPVVQDAQVFARGMTLEIFPAAELRVGQTVKPGRYAYDAEARLVVRIGLKEGTAVAPDPERDAELAELSPAIAAEVERISTLEVDGEE